MLIRKYWHLALQDKKYCVISNLVYFILPIKKIKLPTGSNLG